MNPEIFTHYGTQIRKRSRRSKRALLKAIVLSKRNVIESTNNNPLRKRNQTTGKSI